MHPQASFAPLDRLRVAGYDHAISRAAFTRIKTWQLLAQALQDKGMTIDEAALVMGGNMLRVAGQVWPGENQG